MDKNYSAKNIAFNTSLVVACLSVILISASFYLINDWIFLILSGIIVFIISFFCFSKALDKYISERVKLIYKSISNTQTSENRINKINPSKDIIGEVNEEVINWAKSKKEEIEQLKNTARYRREFLANVSHELKTPIFNIEGYLHTLIDGGIDNNKINKEYLIKATRNLDRLTAIIQDLETISQLESGQLNLNIVKFDIKKLVREIFEDQEMMADANDVKLIMNDKSPKPINVSGDKEKIRQVLINLITNSIKYGKTNGTTSVNFEEVDGQILIEVSDDGIGISAEHLPRLFERFYRVDKSRSREKGGSGLGLAIVKHIVEAHGQTINVRSTLESGTTFVFSLQKAK